MWLSSRQAADRQGNNPWLSRLRAALIDAGARSEVADAAAEEAAGHQMQYDALQAKVDTGFSDVRAEFADVRAEFRAEFVKVRAEMAAGFADVRAEMTAGFADNRASIRILQWGQGLIVAGIISLVANAFLDAA